jgi:hypothetical protein
LLYAGKHELDIRKEEDEFVVSLRLQQAHQHSGEYSLVSGPVTLVSAQV